MNKTQKTRAKIPIYLFGVLVIAACILRSFQLLKYTDSTNGYSTNTTVSSVLYLTIAIIGILSAVYSSRLEGDKRVFAIDGRCMPYFVTSVFLCITYFVDFIHQCFNCYYYVSKMAYIEPTYVIPLGLSAFLSLVCCFYFAVFSLTARGSNYDFRSFKYLHFVPIAWGFIKLIMIMVKIVDIRFNVDTCLEFLLISFMLMFLLCFVSAIDRKGIADRMLVFSSMMTISLSFIISASRILIVIPGEWEKLLNVNYTGLTYLALGLFAVVTLKETLKYNFGD